MKDLCFVKIKGKSQLVALGPKMEAVHLKYFKTHSALSYQSTEKIENTSDAERHSKQSIWSMIKAANKKTPSFEKWSKEMNDLTITEAISILNEIRDKFNKRKVK